MKNLLQLLLILLALSLCALTASQWVREVHLRTTLQQERTLNDQRAQAIAEIQAALSGAEREIQRLENARSQLTQAAKTEQTELQRLRESEILSKQDLTRSRKEAEVCRSALASANESIQRANAIIARQNQDVKSLSEQRSNLVERFNRLASDYNELAAKWNELQGKPVTPPAQTE